ncbi:MAG: leucyl aminopeptidase family protein [Deltaproteobacteria bacterium]|nr:leucyl aminopeptidase family protein [Deltaproteobacteria bacterium]
MAQEPTFSISPSPSHANRLHFCWQDSSLFPPDLPPTLKDLAQKEIKRKDFSGKPGQCLILQSPLGCWVIVGLGKAEDIHSGIWLNSLGVGFKALGSVGAKQISLVPPESPQGWAEGLLRTREDQPIFSGGYGGQGVKGTQDPLALAWRLAMEAAWMAEYRFDRYLTRSQPPEKLMLEWVGPGHPDAMAQALKEAQIVGQAIWRSRDWIHWPASEADPGFMTQRVEEIAAATGSKLQVIIGNDLLKQGYGAMWAVGKGASVPPVLACLIHDPPEKKDLPLLALVGKGVTFDSGGLEIKTSSGMQLMRKDMGGAAAVLGAFSSVVQLNLPLRVLCVVGLAENAVGPGSFKPGDVLHTKMGLTVEVTSTDAEGRLVLADCFALAKSFQPHWMVDMATLTGACRTALGKNIMGLFSNHPGLQQAVISSAQAVAEPVWPLPLWKEYGNQLESNSADLANASSSGFGGAITAALFLQEFVGDTPWAHLDCYQWSDGEHPLLPKGGTASGIRLVVDLARRLTQKES